MSEPTSKFNDLSSETVTKLVSIIVAIVVFAVVLVPIVNGLADGNGEGDGGGGGDTEDYVVINTLQDFYGGTNVTFNYKSYQIYASSDSANRYSEYSKVLPEGYSMTLNLDTLNEYKNNISVPTGYGPDQTIPILKVSGSDESSSTEIPNLNVAWDTQEGLVVDVWGDDIYTTTIDLVTAFTVTITDTHIYWTITSTWDNSTDPATYSADYDLTDTVDYMVLYASNDDVGWIPSLWGITLRTSPYTSYSNTTETMEGGIISINCDFKFEINGNEGGESEIVVVIPVENISADNTLTGRISRDMLFWDDDNDYYGTALLEYEIHLIPTTDGKYKLSYGESNDNWSLVSISDIKDEEGNPIAVEITNTELWYAENYAYFTMYSSVNTNPLTYSGENGNGGSGSGSSTDSAGISGTAGTILKIIPVLVGVGVILAIVALFYDPRNLIKKD